ncbi:MAG: N-methylhydantoinase, partial [Hyphomicrobiales bacterium]|nr:N-methylhydantoinase [Hyphomicrobiales bacterium]
MEATLRVGVDIGGTFTDIVVLGSDGSIHTKKISSSVGDYARAIVDGLAELFAETGLSGAAIEEIRHGTTVASNAILEHKGARVGLITTKGFRDVLEIRTLRMPRLYDLTWTKPTPMVERYLRKVVDERIDHKGNIERALDPADAGRVVDALLAEKIEAIAVCLINSFANPAHELMIKEVVRRKAPQLPLSVSFEVLPEIKEYERTSTTVINAYVMPIVATYLRALRAGLDAAGIPARLLLMQSNGGLTTDAAAAARPMNIVESGPAGGVVGAQAVARSKKLAKIITFDMGGTTAKASMVEYGEVTRAQEYAVGAGIMIGSRLLTGAGYTLKVPAIDLAEVGAGGGSHVWIDAGGALQIGPESAGASPGPVCYGQGGTVPTVTDANVLLGYINPQHLVGGALKLDVDKARKVFADAVAAPLKMTAEDAAYGAHQIAASNMIRAIRAVSSERGRDPREFTLFAFGGNGPLFAAGMAAALGIRRIVVPPCAGLFSSFGLLYADVEYHFSRTFRRVLRQADLSQIGEAWDALSRQAADQLAIDGFAGATAQLRRSAALHYKGQTYELIVPVPEGPIDPTMVSYLEEAFGTEHERT